MPKTWSIPPAVVITALTAFLSGGLAGAVFSWLVNRREPTVVTYAVNRTELADPKASALIPNLSVHVGKESIQELHAYTVDIDIPQGPEVERAQVGIFFPHKVRIYGKSTETPSQLYNMNCAQVDNGVTCQIAPVSRANKKGYRIVLATDEKESPSVEVAAKSVEVLSAAEFVSQKSNLWESLGSTKSFGIVFGVLAVIVVFVAQIKLARRVSNSYMGPGILVGKICDESGSPIKDADVEVALESPSNHSFPPAKTDRFGDFLLGRNLYKYSLYKGRIRVTHPNYEPLETVIDSPIVSLNLKHSDK